MNIINEYGIYDFYCGYDKSVAWFYYYRYGMKGFACWHFGSRDTVAGNIFYCDNVSHTLNK